MEINQKFKPDSALKLVDQVRQALNAIIYKYKKVLDINIDGWLTPVKTKNLRSYLLS